MDGLVLKFTLQLLSRVAEGISPLRHFGDGLHQGIDETIIGSSLVLKTGDLEQRPGDLPSVDPSPVLQLK